LVLVVDDSPVDRRLASGLLEKQARVRTVGAANGREALALIVQERPSLVLTDMQMPEMDGLELVEEMRQRHPLVPVILMTANGSEDIAVKALQTGAASYVPKRLLDKELAHTVEQILHAATVDRRRQKILECVVEMDCRLVLENDPALVPPLVVHFQEQLLRMGLCDENSKIRVGVALEEAVLNAIYHGNLEMSSDLRQDGGDAYQKQAAERRVAQPYAPRRVHMRAELGADQARFVVRDEGPGFDLSKLPDPTDPENLLKLSGRGLLLIRTFMDEVSHNDKGNEITLVRKRR